MTGGEERSLFNDPGVSFLPALSGTRYVIL